MLENEFFPTPNATISEMVSFANYESDNDGSVLDPNGGSGAILDHLKEFNTNRYYSDTFENEHFKFKIFKKGTLHIDFKDLKVLDQINLIAAEGKNWIGQGY